MSRLFLIGYRCTGKSTVGRILARQLNWHFVDADEELERQTGRTVREIFEREGEKGFRDREEKILETLSDQGQQVIATGGGVILREANRLRLRNNGFVAWLTAPPEAIWLRMQTDANTLSRRPALAQGGLAEVAELVAQRQPLYTEVAHIAVETEGRSPEVIAAAILAGWTKHCSNSLPRVRG